MKARHQRPQMLPTMFGFAAPGRSDRHVAICDTGDASPPPSPSCGHLQVHINPTVSYLQLDTASNIAINS